MYQAVLANPLTEQLGSFDGRGASGCFIDVSSQDMDNSATADALPGPILRTVDQNREGYSDGLRPESWNQPTTLLYQDDNADAMPTIA